MTFRQPAAFGQPWPAIVAFAALYGGLIVFVLPKLESGKVVPDLARWLQPRLQGDEGVATFRLNRWNPAFRFYVDRPVTMVVTDDELRTFVAASAPRYVVATKDGYEQMRQAGAALSIVYSRDGVWATSGRLLWRERGAPTTFVVAERVRAPDAD